MNELFDVHAYLDGFEVTYAGAVIWQGNTWTGAGRAMIAFREAYRQAAEDLSNLLQTRKAA